MAESGKRHQVRNSYLLWLPCLFGVNGLHRLYNGKIATGLLWFFTGGLLGIGQFVDLFLMPRMAASRLKQLQQPAQEDGASKPRAMTANEAMVTLLSAAHRLGGQISVTQGVLETGLGFHQVEGLLMDMVKTGYVSVDNDPDSGVVIYRFLELEGISSPYQNISRV